MNPSSVKVLIIDDESAIRDVLSASLRDDGFQVEVAADGLRGLDAIRSFRPQIVLLDIWMPGEMDGLEVLKRAKPQFPGVEFIIMSGHGTIETAVKATKLGAWDFVEKPLSMDKISILISNITNYQSERREKVSLLNKLRKSIAIVGDSEQIVGLKTMVARVAPSSSSVLITGENGTGKELVAQNIHYLSSRAGQPFIEVNCAAIPKDLVESELFGYEKGAFTGADKTKKGKFDLARGGTILLDEIGDMTLEAQAKILRILQEKKFVRVGGSEVIDANVRVIAATNKDLTVEIAEGRFREDLYFRLNVIPFNVPALRERTQDIPALIDHFSDQFAKQSAYRKKVFAEESMRALESYKWPGNVRELRNFIERLYILAAGDFIDLNDLTMAGLTASSAGTQTMDMNFREARAEFEKEFLLQKITENNGNISKTAESIGLERSYLHRKIKSYGLDLN